MENVYYAWLIEYNTETFSIHFNVFQVTCKANQLKMKAGIQTVPSAYSFIIMYYVYFIQTSTLLMLITNSIK